MASIFGNNLASITAPAAAVPLPTQLAGVSVTVSGIAAPLWGVSPGQINGLIPFELSPTRVGSPAPVVVTTAAGASAPFYLTLTHDSPGIFTQNATASGPVFAWDSNYQPVTAVGSGPIGMYAAGLGPTNPPPPSSAAGGASTEPLNRITDSLSVFIGDQKATILYAGLAPGYAGIYQLNVVPNGPISDRVYLRANGWQKQHSHPADNTGRQYRERYGVN
jgi:uncharacterized protein (TIGR03437 family)